MLNPKKFLTRYLSSWTVLAMDTALAAAASALAVTLVSLWQRSLFASVSLPLVWVVTAIAGAMLGFLLFSSYRSAIRHTTLREVGRLLGAVIVKEAVLVWALYSLPWLAPLLSPLTPGALVALLFVIDAVATLALLLVVRLLMVMVYDRVRSSARGASARRRVMVYGTDDKAVSLVKRLEQSPHYKIVGFLSKGDNMQGHNLAGYPVHYYADAAAAHSVMAKEAVRGLLFAREKEARAEAQGLIPQCAREGIRVFVAPSIDEIVDGKLGPRSGGVREVKIEDLLGRDEIKISLDEIKGAMQGKTVLVTGAAGSIGSELCRQLAAFGVRELVLFDNAETPMHNVRLEFEEHYPDLKFTPVIGDVRQPQRLDYVFRKFHPQIVFHAAAYKHVPLMEENPCEAVMVNVIGTKHVADKCVEYGVEKMVMISTDKAVNPTNIMGCTKRLAEIYVQSLGEALAAGDREGQTKFVTTRFGNVLGSNGSVIPRFRQQIAQGGPVTVTHPEITRFFMTIPEACRLVMEAATMTTGNQIFVFDMGQSVKIVDMARRMIELAGFRPDEDIRIEFTGLRPGEKLYEEVLSNAENTQPTNHNRIRIACVRRYAYPEAVRVSNDLERLSRQVDIPSMVRLMKSAVPEFVSRNSEFEIYDKK